MTKSPGFPARASAGFTLIELMVTIVIATILLSIAIPSYQAQIRKSRRTEAKNAVLDVAAREERYYSTYNSYTNDALNLGYDSTSRTLFQLPVVGGTYYQVSVCVGNTTSPPSACNGAQALNSVGQTNFLIVAIPLAGSTQLKDSSCLNFSVDSTGKQLANSAADGSGTVNTSTCW
jgi:type IV pilus assembly protein PilE